MNLISDVCCPIISDDQGKPPFAQVVEQSFCAQFRLREGRLHGKI